MDHSAVARRVCQARKARGLTQEDLADRAQVSPTHISVLERGVKLPNLDTFIAIANALQVSADELLQDVVDKSVLSRANALTEQIAAQPLPVQRKIVRALQAFLED